MLGCLSLEMKAKSTASTEVREAFLIFKYGAQCIGASYFDLPPEEIASHFSGPLMEEWALLLLLLYCFTAFCMNYQRVITLTNAQFCHKHVSFKIFLTFNVIVLFTVSICIFSCSCIGVLFHWTDLL